MTTGASELHPHLKAAEMSQLDGPEKQAGVLECGGLAKVDEPERLGRPEQMVGLGRLEQMAGLGWTGETDSRRAPLWQSTTSQVGRSSSSRTVHR